jgi:hypothetical protein
VTVLPRPSFGEAEGVVTRSLCELTVEEVEQGVQVVGTEAQLSARGRVLVVSVPAE